MIASPEKSNISNAWFLGSVSGSEAAHKEKAPVLERKENMRDDVLKDFIAHGEANLNGVEAKVDTVSDSNQNKIITRVAYDPNHNATIRYFGDLATEKGLSDNLIDRVPGGAEALMAYIIGRFDTSRELYHANGSLHINSASDKMGDILKKLGLHPKWASWFDGKIKRGWEITDQDEIAHLKDQSERLRELIHKQTLDMAAPKSTPKGPNFRKSRGHTKPQGDQLMLPLTIEDAPPLRRFAKPPTLKSDIYKAYGGTRVVLENKNRFGQVSGLPGPDSPTPRRRRTIVCSNLTIEGQKWDLEEARAKMRDALRGDKADIRCHIRPGVQIAADYATDVCLSSWCRNCPFLSTLY